LEKFRKHGTKPYKIVALHGGPGAVGDLYDVAVTVAGWDIAGVMEHLQSAKNINGQVEELHSIISKETAAPVTLIGHSWGAWLGWIYTARYPEDIAKLVLVSSGPFEQKYVDSIMSTRLSRMKEDEKLFVQDFLNRFNTKKSGSTKNTTDKVMLTKFGKFMESVDAYDPIILLKPKRRSLVSASNGEVNPAVYAKVWKEAEKLRRTGKLLNYGKKINCPVVVIHGNYDPHPFLGVKKPLKKVLIPEKVEFHLLKKCGHKPWIERQDKDKFLKLIKQIIS